jgi:hypothetical protein
MAIQATVETNFGEYRELYIRLNNLESSNHGQLSYAKFRGFISKEKFDSGANYLWEQDVEFEADVTQPLWGQAYSELKRVLGTECEDC